MRVVDLAIVDAFDRYFGAKKLAGPVDELFPEQRRVFNDPSKRRSIRTTRRAGKTHFNVVDHCNDMERYPGEWSYYITPRLTQSRRNMEGPLRDMIRRHRLPVKRRVVDQQLYYEHENGHTLWIAGCKDMTEAEKFRGDKVRKVKIDEGGAWRSDVLSYLVKECVGPALSDNDGVLDITGTPGAVPGGYWHAVDTGQGTGDYKRLEQWSAHTWSVLTNPHHRYYNRPDLIQAELDKNYGGDDQNPAFLREWRGLWVADLNSIIYHYAAERNLCRESDLPSYGSWFHVLSVDLGWNDQATFTVSCSRSGFREVYFLESYGRGEMLISQIAAEVERVRARYPISKMVIDMGGLGKTIAETLLQEYHLPFVPAKKPEKAVRIRSLANALIGGWAKVDPDGCEQLLSEWEVLTWDKKRLDHNPVCADDCSDGATYGYAEHPAYESWDEEPPVPGTPEAINREAEEMKRAEARRLEIEHSGMSRGRKRRALRRAG